MLHIQQICGQTATYHVQAIYPPGMMATGDIIQITKDDNGFLWLLFPNKVQRYDGKNFLSFSFDDRCLNIQQDAEGTIWLANRQAIYRFKNAYTGFEKIPAYSADSVQYLALLAGPHKKIYLLRQKSIQQWNNKTQQFDSLPISISRKDNSFAFLKSMGNCIFYQKSISALGRYNISTGMEDSITVTNSNFLFPLTEDSVWVRQDIDRTAMVSFSSKTVAPINAVQFAEKFYDNRFFITGSSSNCKFISFNDKGYYAYHAATGTFFNITLLHNGVPLGGSMPIYGFFEDESNGDIWIANEEGLVYFNPSVTTIGLLRSNAAAGEHWNNNVRSFAEDREGNIWFATANGFCMQSKKTGAIKTWLPKFDADNYLNYASVRSIGCSNGKIIIGQSEKGFWIFDPVTENFSKPLFESKSQQLEFENGFNSAMLRLRNGHFLILSRKVWLLNKDNFSISEVKLKGFTPLPRTAYQDAEGRIWFAGRNGVYCCNDSFELLYSYSSPDVNRWANGLLQIDAGTFWFAAKNIYRLTLMPGGQMNISTVFPNQKQTHFSSITKDALGHIWLFADNGIYRYLPAQNILEKFDRSDNAQPYPVSVSNSYLSSRGILYAGSTNGINYFEPEKIAMHNDSLQVQLLNVTVNQDDSSFLLSRLSQSLSYHQNSIVFDFISPSILNAQKIQYRYRLNGVANEWINLGNNASVRLTSMQPGKYKFNVAASINGKDWYEMKSPFEFIIKPPFWKTWWFRSMLTLSLLALLFFYYRRRISLLKTKAAIQQQITGLEVKALRAQMNPHFIFNAMNSIQQFTLKNDVDNANLYLSRFSMLLRKVLHSSQQNQILLEEEIDQLNLYLEIEKLRFGPEFTYSIITDEELEPDAIKIPGMLLQPFVENALKHGLAAKQGLKNLQINFHSINEVAIKAVITDNGIGIKKAHELKLQSDKLLPNQSKGIALVKERVHLLSRPGYPVEILIEELKNTVGDATGTRVSLTIPCL